MLFYRSTVKFCEKHHNFVGHSVAFQSWLGHLIVTLLMLILVLIKFITVWFYLNNIFSDFRTYRDSCHLQHQACVTGWHVKVVKTDGYLQLSRPTAYHSNYDCYIVSGQSINVNHSVCNLSVLIWGNMKIFYQDEFLFPSNYLQMGE